MDNDHHPATELGPSGRRNLAPSSDAEPSLLFSRPISLRGSQGQGSGQPRSAREYSSDGASTSLGLPERRAQEDAKADADGLRSRQSSGADVDVLAVEGETLRPFCRICFEGEAVEPLIAPCQCRGTQKYVHRTCLDSWRAARVGFAFAHCTECRSAFVLRSQVPADRRWKQLKFRTCVALDHLLLFLTVQVIVAGIAYFVFALFGDQLQTLFGYDEQPQDFRTVVAVVSGAVGVLYGFFVSVICSEYIEGRHLHVLQRKPLTHEYYVEDLEAADVQAVNSLKPEHEQELVSMGLLGRH